MNCSVPKCRKVAEKRGWCQMHYRRWQRHGSVDVLKRRTSGTGSIYIDKDGYLRLGIGRKSWKIHRLIMEHLIGRQLEADELVHHKDEDRLNNHPSNLEVMRRPAHISHHHKGVRDLKGVPEGMKFCRRCLAIKPLDEFYPEPSNGVDQVRAYCKTCCATISAGYHERAKNRTHGTP